MPQTKSPTKFIVANFKSHQTTPEAEEWVKKFTSIFQGKPGVAAVILAPSFSNLHIYETVQYTLLAAQDVSPFPPGAYTGAVNARQLKDLGANYCLVGHSERRQWFGETHSQVARKARELWDQKICPIVCLDQDYARDQIAALEPFPEPPTPVLYAYEPVESIGTGHPQNPAEVENIINDIRRFTEKNSLILYGGSITANNAKQYLSLTSVAGLLVGTASLDPNEFNAIINQI